MGLRRDAFPGQHDPSPSCATCGKPIERNPNPFGQSAWRHTDRSGAGVGGHADNWCETGTGYVKVAPADRPVA